LYFPLSQVTIARKKSFPDVFISTNVGFLSGGEDLIGAGNDRLVRVIALELWDASKK
jgi:hypothetical protein